MTTNNNYLEKPYKYIYNYKQALFFLKGGADIFDIGKNDKTGNTKFIFVNNDKLQELFSQWNLRNRIECEN